MPPAGFEPEIPAEDRPQTIALDRSGTGIGHNYFNVFRQCYMFRFEQPSTDQWLLPVYWYFIEFLYLMPKHVALADKYQKTCGACMKRRFYNIPQRDKSQ